MTATPDDVLALSLDDDSAPCESDHVPTVLQSPLDRLDLSLPPGDVVPLPVLCNRFGWDRRQQHKAVREGLITPVEQRGPDGRYQVTRADAVVILVAGLFAEMIGVPPIFVLRPIRDARIETQVLAEALVKSQKLQKSP